MTTSSQQPSFSITSSDTGVIAQDVGSIYPDTLTIDLSSMSADTITLTSESYNTTVGYSAITTSTGSYNTVIGGVDTISVSDINSYQSTWKVPEEFVDAFPDWDRIQNMCKEYPGLEIAFEKFKTTYKLVKDDYDTPKHKRKTP